MRRKLVYLLGATGVLGVLGLGVSKCLDFVAPSVHGGAEHTAESRRPIDWDWDLYFRVAGDRIEYRFHGDQPFVPTPARASVPAAVARIDKLAPVPIEIRYVDVFGFRHQTKVMFDVPRGISGQTKAYLHEAVNWAILVRAAPAAPARAIFNGGSDDCVTVRYSVDSDALDRKLERHRSSEEVELPGDPEWIAVRYDFCDGSTSETVHEAARLVESRYEYVEPRVVFPRSKNY